MMSDQIIISRKTLTDTNIILLVVLQEKSKNHQSLCKPSSQVHDGQDILIWTNWTQASSIPNQLIEHLFPSLNIPVPQHWFNTTASQRFVPIFFHSRGRYEFLTKLNSGIFSLTLIIILVIEAIMSFRDEILPKVCINVQFTYTHKVVVIKSGEALRCHIITVTLKLVNYLKSAQSKR